MKSLLKSASQGLGFATVIIAALGLGVTGTRSCSALFAEAVDREATYQERRLDGAIPAEFRPGADGLTEDQRQAARDLHVLGYVR